MYEIIIFIVLFCLLVVIVALNKQQLETFRLLNCKLSKLETPLSDEDYVCCEAKNMLDVLDEDDTYYDYFRNIYDSCNQISSVDLRTTDPLSSYDINHHYQSLEHTFNLLIADSNVLQREYQQLYDEHQLLEETYDNELRIYHTTSNLFRDSNIRYAELSNIKTTLSEIDDLHEYKTSLLALDDVINKNTMDEIEYGTDQGLVYKEEHLQDLIEKTLNGVLTYIPKLSDLYLE